MTARKNVNLTINKIDSRIFALSLHILMFEFRILALLKFENETALGLGGVVFVPHFLEKRYILIAAKYQSQTQILLFAMLPNQIEQILLLFAVLLSDTQHH